MQNLLVAGLLLLSFGAQAQSTLYRCRGDQSEPLFSNVPCTGTAVLAPSAPADAPAGGIRAAEKAWLRSREASRRPASRFKHPPAVARGAADARRCRKKRQQAGDVSARLRRGYRPAQGERLRRKRRALEDYLRHHCT
jgi:hypothetical protein